MHLRTTVLTVLLALAGSAPALAQTTPSQPPALGALKPCYVAAQENQREPVEIAGSNFTPFGFVDVFVDDVHQDIPGTQPQAAFDGTLMGSVPAPFIEAGQRPFTLRVTERANTARTVVASSRVARLSVEQSPASASTRQRVRFRGRGFTDLTKPVYMHYVYAGKSRNTQLIGPPTGDCGLFSIKRRQFPFKKSPRVGLWTIQFDQEARYNPKANPRVPLTIRVRKAITPPRARAR